MIAQLDTRDWFEAFEYASPQLTRPGAPSIALAPFDREDVHSIEGIDEGENDYTYWLIFGLLKDGRAFGLKAGCCYTGWDAAASGSAAVAHTTEEIVRFFFDRDERLRLKVPLPEEVERKGVGEELRKAANSSGEQVDRFAFADWLEEQGLSDQAKNMRMI